MIRFACAICTALLCALTATGVARSADSCLMCHGDGKAMQQSGFPQFAVTQKEVEAQSRMPAGCSDCHLGNPAAMDRAGAHKGLARLLPVGKRGFTVITSVREHALGYGTNETNRIYALTRKDGKLVKDPKVVALLWHDKRIDTLTQNFTVMQQTCGTCHAKEFAEFEKSTMGRNAKQSLYKGWTSPERGPHNCGPWFDGNYERIQANTTIPMTRSSAETNQKACNICHVGCLDCHYNPQPVKTGEPGSGIHAFARRPPSLSCYGNGRGSVCHAGPEDRRRGAGYFGGSFSFPEGNEPDVHLKVNVGCLDCHENSASNPSLGHAMVKRQAGNSCGRCHGQAVQSHKTSVHRMLTCEACHVQRVGGYQGTYWGPGTIAGAATPFFKYKAYYGIMPEPILIKDQQGRWIPVKPFPMAALNQKEAPFKPGLHWRYPASLPDLQRTDDAWAFTGLWGGMPENNKALTWIQVDKMSHKLGPARTCDSCHLSPDGAQRQVVTWDYSDPGAAPFSGGHTVTASAQGLVISDIHSNDRIEPEKGHTLSSFAPWLFLKDVWRVQGDFALPVIRDRSAYDGMKTDAAKARQAGVLHR